MVEMTAMYASKACRPTVKLYCFYRVNTHVSVKNVGQECSQGISVQFVAELLRIFLSFIPNSKFNVLVK